jgi:hypothetical protein
VHQPSHEVDVAPVQAERFAQWQAGVAERPVQRSVLGVIGVGGEQLDLVAEVGVELAGEGVGRPVDEIRRRRVDLELPHPASALEHSVADGEVADDRARREPALSEQPAFVGVDHVGVDLLERPVAELGIEVAGDHTAVVGDGVRVDLALLLAEAQELGARVAEGGAGLVHPRQLTPAGLREQLLHRLVRGALGVVASWRAAGLLPGTPGPPLALAALREPVDRTNRLESEMTRFAFSFAAVAHSSGVQSSSS